MPQKQVTADVQKNQDARVRSLAVTEGGFALSNPAFEIDTNFDIQNGEAFDMVVGGLIVSVAADQNFDTGTAKTIAIDQWAAALLSIDADGTTYVQWTADAATEALAIEKLDGISPSGECVLGYVTVLTNDGTNWTAGTDALQGGAGGDVSDDTNYYEVFGWVL